TRMRHALGTEQIDEAHAKSLLFWARSYLIFCNNDEPEQLGRTDLEAYLAHISEDRFAGKPSQKRALEAIQRLYQSTAYGTPAWLKIFIEERRSDATPNILSRDEIARLLARLGGRDWLAAALVYGTGIRLLECVRLRVRDIDLEGSKLLVRDSADQIKRSLPLPENIQGRLLDHLEELKLMHIRDIVDGAGQATLPPVVSARQPAVARKWAWQYLFPQRSAAAGAHQSAQSVHHVDPQTVHRQIERAALDARIYRRVTGHVLRNSFALHMIQQGTPIESVERMLGTRKPESEDLEIAASSLQIPAVAAGVELRSTHH
ncbi:MAG: tyrosine-type recombinase/integrase, partial [Wenzhouxiangellaceae bacterium]|nr:tyrosine-type recombinase/integrase [Wenzhouxiangellaceae bacterium]